MFSQSLTAIFLLTYLQSTKTENSGSSFDGDSESDGEREDHHRANISAVPDTTSVSSADPTSMTSPPLPRVNTPSTDRKLPITTAQPGFFPVFDSTSPFSSFYPSISMSSQSNGIKGLNGAVATPAQRDGDDRTPCDKQRRRRCKRRLLLSEEVESPTNLNPKGKPEVSRSEPVSYDSRLLHVPTIRPPQQLNENFMEQLGGRFPAMTSSHAPVLSALTPVSDQILNGRYGCSPLAIATTMAYLQATGYDAITAADISRWIYAAGHLQSKLEEFSGDCWTAKVMDGAMESPSVNKSKDLASDIQPLDLSPLVKRIAVRPLI